MALAGKVCLVTGATRGIGKGVAVQLGEAGATVYITGRTLKSDRGEGSLVETADEIKRRGGQCVPVVCDHTNEQDIKVLFERIAKEQNGQLDVLVNNAYGGVKTIIENIKKPFWESDPAAMWDVINNAGLRNHYICSAYAARLMTSRKCGIIINMSSIGGLRYLFNVAYGVGKQACDRMAADCAVELRKHNVSFISLWPGYIKTEIFMDAAGTSSVAAKKNFVEYGATPEYVGKIVVQLSKEPTQVRLKRSGKICFADDVANMYGISDIDGKRPLHMRSLKLMLLLSGFARLARWVPSWMKLPKFILSLSGYKF